MQDAVLVGLAREAIRASLVLAAGPLAAALVAGLLVALGQAMTQMNEPTVGLVARLAATAVVALVLLPWLLARWLHYASATLGGLADLI